MTIFRDQQSMMAALEAGTLDVAELAPIQDTVRLKSDPKYTVYENHDIGQFFYATVSTINGPTTNKSLRQALSYAIDRQRFVDQIMKGLVGEPRDLPWAAASPAFDSAKNKFYTFDLDKAKALVAQSGLTNIEFDIAWATAGYSGEYAALAQIMQSDFAKIGVKTNLKPTDPAAFTAQGAGTQPQYSGMRLSAGAFAQLNEAASEFALSRTFGYLSNGAGYYDPAYETLVTSASTEPDAAKRKEMYGKINDYLLDAAYVDVISPYTNIMVMRSNVKNLKYEIATTINIRDIWLA